MEQTLRLLKTILQQNYFQHNNQFYQPNKVITMGSPISSTLAEIYLQYLEEKCIKHCLKHKDIVYYKRYVDDLLIIYDQSRVKVDKILNSIYHVDDHLEFKIPKEVNNTLQYVDQSISRNDNNIELGIYRNPTNADIMIHCTPYHPYDHKLAAFIFYINRMITMPITCQAISREWHKILEMAQNNGFSKHVIHELNKKLTKKDTCYTDTLPTTTKQWMVYLHVPRTLRTQDHQSIQKNWFENIFPPH
jgi:hypothetical protein